MIFSKMEPAERHLFTREEGGGEGFTLPTFAVSRLAFSRTKMTPRPLVLAFSSSTADGGSSPPIAITCKTAAKLPVNRIRNECVKSNLRAATTVAERLLL